MTSENRNLNSTVSKVGEVAIRQSPNSKAVVHEPPAVDNAQVRVATKFASQNVQVAGRKISRQSAQIRVEEVHAQVANVAVHTVPAPNASRPLGGGSKAEIGDAPHLQPNRHSSSPTQDPLPITNAEHSPSQDSLNAERGLVQQTTQLLPRVQNGAGQVLKRTGAASKQPEVARNVEEVHVEAGNIAVDALRAEAIVEEEKKYVCQTVEFTDDGNVTYRQYELIFQRRIIEVLYIASLNEPEDPEEPTATEKCIDCCCQSIHCNFSEICRCFTRRNPEDQPAFKTENYMSPILRRGRSKGWAMLKELIPGIVKESCRNWWISFQLCTVIVSLILSIVTFSLGKNRIFNILHLALTLLGSILSITDNLLNLCGCGLLKTCRACCKHVPENDDESLSAPYIPLQEEAAVTEAERCEKCKTHIANTKSIFDFSRIILTEVLIYPILICNIFEVIIGKAYLFSNVTDGISFALFVISSASLFFFLYIVKLTILIVANIHSQKQRKPKTENEKETQSQFLGYDPAIRKSAKYLQCYFTYHVAVQMLAQILMIIAIGAKIRDDNSHLFEDTESDDSIHVSGTLWYMLVAGYVLPFFGIITFFVVTYFWVQEFPIGFCIDCVTLLKAAVFKTPGINNVVDFGEAKEKIASKIDKIYGHVHLDKLIKEFKSLRQKPWSDKFFYPFKTPQMVIICLIYAFLQLSFIICAGISTSGNGRLGGGYWEIFYTLAIIVGFIANFYVFLVALLWSAIIISVIVFIAILLSLLIFCCLIACVSSPPSNNRQR